MQTTDDTGQRAQLAPRRIDIDDLDAALEHYSPRNVQTLLSCGATLVAGYREWQLAGRQVRKGEKGIPLVAPRTVKDEETGERAMRGVSTAYVFDVSQTDEDPTAPERAKARKKRRQRR